MPTSRESELLRQIPPVDQLLLRPRIAAWVRATSRPFVVSEIQSLLAEIRRNIRTGEASLPELPVFESLEAQLEQRMRTRLKASLRPVINATGVILHTNLGRAPFSAGARDSLSAILGRYTNLEYDLASGERSHRDKIVESALMEILGCEAATVVNNNAAAVFLILNSLAAGSEVLVSRGELVEIGGSFRLPDIMERSGAILREVGTTNKTRAGDYESAVGAATTLLLRVHPSNFRIRGFTARPELPELVELARRRGIPLAEDLGSGCLLDLEPLGVREEPVVQKSLAAGVDLVCFSGDKLLGGPQAGIIAGRKVYVDRIRKNPLARVCRVEKLILCVLEATLGSYRTGRAMQEVPVLRMISTGAQSIEARSRVVLQRLHKDMPADAGISVESGYSVIGGGSCPEGRIPTRVLSLTSERYGAGELERRLRCQDPPIIARVEEARLLLDLRTVDADQEDELVRGILTAVN